MEIKELEILIDKINNSNISLFEVKIDNTYIKMDKSLNRNSVEIDNNKAVSMESYNEMKNSISSDTDTKKEVILNEEIKVENINVEDLYTIKSPMVGTFYIAPGAGVDPFVKTGSKINKGDTLCIIEAMKLMNELESDVSGEIIEILVQDGELVEYGSELFRVKKA
ncbi:MAG: acetyl-CoA carboxylase biotin carboxyl carrier protein [Sarcina sp.]